MGQFKRPVQFHNRLRHEGRLQMLSATDLYHRWGGAQLYARSAAGYKMHIQVDPDAVPLGSIFDFVTYSMNTTDTFHVYRAEALNNVGRLYVDGVFRLRLNLGHDNPIPDFWFADQ